MSEKTPLETVAKEVEQSQEVAENDKRRGRPRSNQHLRAAVVYETIRAEGEAELTRKFHALWWSGLAAGLSIGFSFLTEAWLSSMLPDENWKPLIENFGYTVGFLIVILGHQQLFTENTLTAVLPVISRRRMEWVYVLLRLWITVLAANLVGCLFFALFLSKAGAVSVETHAALMEIAKHMMDNTVSEMFFKGIVAGWLIAALVWMLPSVEGSEFPVIMLITYLIALGDLTHVIAGSAEAFFLVIEGGSTLHDAAFKFFLPTLAGNVFGGTILFSVLSYVQVREEIAGQE